MSQRSLLLLSMLIGIGAVVGGYFFGQSVVNKRLADVVALSQVEIAEQLDTVASVSEVMASGGVDAVTERVIKDCPVAERNRFDELLSKLNGGLARPELQELSRLYDRCASYFSRRKAVMAARLEREVEIYELLTKRYYLLADADDSNLYTIKEWMELVALEKSQSAVFERLVTMQGSIISELLIGRTVNSDELKELLREVGEAQQMQTYNAVKMTELRATLTRL